MINTIYILGIPKSPEFITNELEDFINSDVPTLYLTLSSEVKNYSLPTYNYLRENNVKQPNNLEFITEEDILSNIKCLCSTSNIYPQGNNIFRTAETSAKNLTDILNTTQSRFPNVRIAYVTYGNPYYNYAHVPILRDHIDNLEIVEIPESTDTNTNNFREASIILGESRFDWRIYTHDRSGIFTPNNNPSLPENLTTTKTYSQIVDETAQSYLGKNPIVAWSGGIDSTLVIAAFIKNGVDFKVTVSTQCEEESKEVYDYVIEHCDTIRIPDSGDLSNIIVDSFIVTGDANDQLFPDIHQTYIPNSVPFKYLVLEPDFLETRAAAFDVDVDEKYLFNNVESYFIDRHMEYFSCDRTRSQRLYNEYIKPRLDKFPIDIKHFYQLEWFYKFIFKFHLTGNSRFANRSNCDPNKVKAFFNTEDFQRWAVTNLDNNFATNAKHYYTYKMPAKQYNYEVLNLESLLTKTKYPSFFRE